MSRLLAFPPHMLQSLQKRRIFFLEGDLDNFWDIQIKGWCERNYLC